MHELGVKRFFDVHGEMGIKLVNVDGHEWPKRAAITINELRDALTSKMRDQQNYFKDFYVRKMIKEVLKEEGVIDEIIGGIHKAAEKNGFDCFDKEKEKKIKVNIEVDNNSDWLAGLTKELLEEIYANSRKSR